VNTFLALDRRLPHSAPTRVVAISEKQLNLLSGMMG
jgi:hypothetical protein